MNLVKLPLVVGAMLLAMIVQAGVDFATAKSNADTSHVPLIVVYSPAECHYCDVLEEALSGAAYSQWMFDRGYIGCITQEDVAKDFARNYSGGYPFVAVYWNKDDEQAPFLEKFTGRDGKMPIVSGSLAEQFMRSVDYAIFKSNANCTNDDFADACEIDAESVSFGVNSNATSEENEPLTTRWGDATTTIWWKWTARENGKATFDTIGSEVDTVMGVYTGDAIGNLEVVVEDDDGGEINGASKLSFRATAGITYYIAVAGRSGASGGIVLTRSFVFTPTFTYDVLDGCATITGADRIPATLEIPDEIDGYPVVAIGARAFNSEIHLEHVTIPNSVTNIGGHAFSLCYGLCEVTIPDSVKVIGRYAFFKCYELEEVTIGSGVRVIDNWTFGECFSLARLYVADGVTTIGKYSFDKCYSLESVTLPRSVSSVKWGAFADNPGLATVYFPSSLKGHGSSGVFENSPNVSIVYYNCQTPVAPPPVDGIEATEDLDGLIQVRWTMDSDAEVSGYKVYRALRPHFRKAVLVAELPADGCNECGGDMLYEDTDVSSEYTYCYWVVPVNDVFEGETTGPALGYCEENALEIVTADLPTGAELSEYRLALQASSGGNMLIWSTTTYEDETGMPPGLTLSENGVISGVPIQAGVFTFTVECTDIDFATFASAEFTLEITENANRKPEISSTSQADGAYLLLAPDSSLSFNVAAQDPDGFAVTYAWIVDGEEVLSGADANEYVISTAGEAPGTRHDIVCYVNDDLWENIVSRRWTVYVPQTLYVDAADGSDDADGLSREHALVSLQAAIDHSADGDTIIVADGVYAPIETRNRRIVIESEAGYKNAVIDGGGTNNCALLGGPEHYTPGVPLGYGDLWQGTNTVLRGFTLRNGRGMWGAGVTAGTVENCLIAYNMVEAIPMESASPNGIGGGAYLSVLRNCTIIGNASWSAFSEDGTDREFGGVGGGSYGCQLFNCIEWKNAETSDEPYDSGWREESVYEDCCLDDPFFADALNGDYRLVQGSPCIVNGVVVAGCEPEIADNRIYYVDAANGSDNADGLAKATALRSIQAAVDRAISGDTVIVAAGTYTPVVVDGKHLLIESESGYKSAVIDGGGTNGCVSCWNFGLFYPDISVDTNTTIRGFTLRNGRAIHGAGAVGGTLEYCLVTGNVAYNEEPGFNATFYYGEGGGAYCSTLRHCTVVGNTAERWSGYHDGDPSATGGKGGGAYGCVIENCIVTDNEGAVSPNVSNTDSSGYNCVGDDPMFSDSAHGDYRLVQGSPCIVNGLVVAGCEPEIASAQVPSLSAAEVESWVSTGLAMRFAKSGESAEEYESRFVEKFGSDPVAAMTKTTDKKDAQGNEMYVWQDYVAGTDPTDTNSVFTAKVEIVDSTPVVTWEPKLSDGEEALRNYTIYGKTNLNDMAWHSPTNEASRFFKVEVDMK